MRKFSPFSLVFMFILALVNIGALSFPQTINAMEKIAPKNVKAVAGPGAGQVTLTWDAVPDATRYAVSYGTVSNKYTYGATNIGGENASSYTVNYLTPANKYYFRIAAARDNDSGPYSTEVSSYPGAGGVIMPVTSPSRVVAGPAIPKGVGKQALTAVSGPGWGEVTLYWKDADSANNYHLMYGTENGKYKFGALNIGKTNKYTVKMLAGGTRYYFALVPLFNDRPLYTTAAVTAVTGGSNMTYTQIVETNREALIEPPPFKAPKVTPPPEVMENSKNQKFADVEDAFPTGQPTSVPLNQQNVQGIQDSKVTAQNTDPSAPGYVYQPNDKPFNVQVGKPSDSDVDWGK